MKLLGLDIGTNSVGSAWVDTEAKTITIGVSVFPAGVEESEEKRGAPKNQARRGKRSLRRSIHRRALRKRRLRELLTDVGLLPREQDKLQTVLGWDPWELRRKGLSQELTCYEFGRVLVHLNQRRGALGIEVSEGDEGKVKGAIDRVRLELLDRYASPGDKERLLDLRQSKDDDEQGRFATEFANWLEQSDDATFGRMMADLHDDRRVCILDEKGNPKKNKNRESRYYHREPIRNRRDSFQFHADRALIRDEFRKLWKKQCSFDGDLSRLLTDTLKKQFDDPECELYAEKAQRTWRHGGALFGQRATYWDTGVLGRCALEPTDRCVPIADMHAQYFRVVETVNNIRICSDWQAERPLTEDERDEVISLLRGPLFKKSKGKEEPKQSASVTDIREVLGIRPRDKSVWLNIEKDEDREINTDWFHREVVHNAIGLKHWEGLDDKIRERINRVILKYDAEKAVSAAGLRQEATQWWGLSSDRVDALVSILKERPKLEKRLNLSRRAIVNLLPYMETFDRINNRWPTQQEARKAFAEDAGAIDATSGKPPDDHARRRYATGALGATASDRYYMKQDKHQIQCANGTILPPLPPAPMMSNPVVRKAIHEVRRHIMAYLQKFGGKPDRIVIEFARSAKQSAKVRDQTLVRNRYREKERKKILVGDDREAGVVKTAFGDDFANLSLNQQRAAVDRVILAHQQQWKCPYCGKSGLAATDVALGQGVEIDHIVPYSRCGDNGLNNKVVCHVECNRQKRKRTPTEWWGEEFAERARTAKKLFDDVEKGQMYYFTKRDYARKWHNFTREVRDNEWRNSQGSDTAYASTQVAAYLADALFDGKGLPERGGERKIFVTIGKYTSMLRRDWQLFKTLKKSKAGGEVCISTEEEEELEQKDRGDHRQHAIDAVVVALTTPNIISAVAQRAAMEESIFAEHGHWPGQRSRRETCRQCHEYRNRSGRFPGEYEPIVPPKPWDDVKEFRDLVLSQVGAPQSNDGLTVAHRPVKRRIAGAFHEDTLFGTIKDSEALFTGRIPCYSPPDTWLKPAHLRVMKPETEKQSVERLTIRYVNEGCDKKTARNKAKGAVKQPSFVPQLVDPSPGKTGLVRDPALRQQMRQCLRANNIDPDNYEKSDMKRMVQDGLLRMYSQPEWKKNSQSESPEKPTGIPIKSVVLLRTHTDPIIVPRKKWDPINKKMVREEHSRSFRVYVGGNNHHIEITEGEDGSWDGDIITNHKAAQRNAERLTKLREAGVPSIEKLRKMNKTDRRRYASTIREINRSYPVVNRADREGRRFVMSLAEGETICMKHPQTGKQGYFVVYKLDKPHVIHLKHHWDARPDGGQKDDDGKVIPGSKREGFSVSAGDLKTKCSLGEGEPPCKVRIDPLGNPRKVLKD